LYASIQSEAISRWAVLRSNWPTLAILDVPLPGIDPGNQIVQTPPTWHFRFYSVQDVPEMLITGHELEYLKWFHNSEAVNSRAFTSEGEETYARVYATPGALRARFECYRAFPNDVKANQRSNANCPPSGFNT
jgi:hypothetical protein